MVFSSQFEHVVQINVLTDTVGVSAVLAQTINTAG